MIDSLLIRQASFFIPWESFPPNPFRKIQSFQWVLSPRHFKFQCVLSPRLPAVSIETGFFSAVGRKRVCPLPLKVLS